MGALQRQASSVLIRLLILNHVNRIVICEMSLVARLTLSFVTLPRLLNKVITDTPCLYPFCCLNNFSVRS